MPLPGRKLSHGSWLPPPTIPQCCHPHTLLELASSPRGICSNLNWKILQPVTVTGVEIQKQSSWSLRASIIWRKTATHTAGLTQSTTPPPSQANLERGRRALYLSVGAELILQDLYRGSSQVLYSLIGLKPVTFIFSHGGGVFGRRQPGHKRDTHFLRE